MKDIPRSQRAPYSFLLLFLAKSIALAEEEPVQNTPTPFPTPEAIWQTEDLQSVPNPALDVDDLEGNSYYVYWGPNVPDRPYYIYRESQPDSWYDITPTPVYVEIQSDPQQGFFYFQEPDDLPYARYNYRIWALGAGVTTDDAGNEPPPWKGGILIPTPTPLPTPEAIWQDLAVQPDPSFDIDEVFAGTSFLLHWGNNVPNGSAYQVWRKYEPGHYELLDVNPVFVDQGGGIGYCYIEEPDSMPPGQYYYKVQVPGATDFSSDESLEPPLSMGGITIIMPPLPDGDLFNAEKVFTNPECGFCCESFEIPGYEMGRNNLVTGIQVKSSPDTKNPAFYGITGSGNCRYCGGAPQTGEVLCGPNTFYRDIIGVHFVEVGSQPVTVKTSRLDWHDSAGGEYCLDYFVQVPVSGSYIDEDVFDWPSPDLSGPGTHILEVFPYDHRLDHSRYIDGVYYSAFLTDNPIYPAYMVTHVFDTSINVTEDTQDGYPVLRINYSITPFPYNDQRTEIVNRMNAFRAVVEGPFWDFNQGLPLPNPNLADPTPRQGDLTIRVKNLVTGGQINTYLPGGWSGEFIYTGQETGRWKPFEPVQITIEGYLGVEVIYCDPKELGPEAPQLAYIADRVTEPHWTGSFTGTPDLTFSKVQCEPCLGLW